MPMNPELTPFLPFAATPREERRSYAQPRNVHAAAPVLSFRNKHIMPEPDDARITGSTRSLYRRLLALNLRKPPVGLRETEAYMPPLTA